MNTRDMLIFTKIADYHSITRTAEEFQITQPAVSSTLKRLEDELGYSLFHRQGKWLSLNEQGSMFYEAAQEFLGEMAFVQEGLQMEDHPKEEIIIKLCTQSDRLYGILGEFTTENPNIRVILRQGDVTKKENFRIVDFSVLMSKDRDVTESFLPLEHRGAMYAILPERHPLTRKPQLTLSDLENERFVFLRGATPTGLEETYQTLIYAGLRPQLSIITDTYSSKYSAIRRGCGIGTAFDHELSLAPLIKDCKLLPVALPLAVDWLCLTWNEEKLSPAGRRFLSFAKERV